MNGHMEDAMEYFAKSPNAKGHQETVKEHCQPDVQQSALGYCTQLRKEAMEEEALWQHRAIASASLSRLFCPHFCSSENGKYIQNSSIFGTLNCVKKSCLRLLAELRGAALGRIACLSTT